MTKMLKVLFKDSILYGISGVISRFISVFLTPLYTRVYSPRDYGVLGILTNGSTLLTIILVLALDNSTARWFFDTNDFDDRKSTVNTWMWFYLFFTVVVTICLFFAAPVLVHWIFKDSQEVIVYMRMLILTLPMMMWVVLANNVLRFERRVVPTITLTLFYTILLIGLNILFVLVLKMGLMGAYWSQLISAFCGMLLSVLMIRKWIGPIRLFDPVRLWKMIKYSLPFVPASLAYWLVNLSGVFFINSMMSKSEAGLFQIGTSIAAMAGLITSAFQQAWAPFAFSILKDESAKDIYARVFYLFVIAVGAFCMFVSLFSSEALIVLATPEYYDAAWVASILCFGYLAIGLTSIADTGTAIAKKTGPLGFISVISAVVMVILNFLLIPRFGKEGAALSICISQFIVPFYMFYRSQIVYPIPYNFSKALILGAVFVSGAILGRIWHIDSFWLRLLFKSLILLSVLYILYKVHKQMIMAFIQTIRNRYSKKGVELISNEIV